MRWLGRGGPKPVGAATSILTMPPGSVGRRESPLDRDTEGCSFFSMGGVVGFGAGVLGSLELDGDVGDAEALGGDGLKVFQHTLAAGRLVGVGGHVGAEDFVTGGDGPDVEVMDAGDAFDGLDAAAQRFDVDVAGGMLHGDMNRLTGDPGTAPEDEGGDADAHRRVYDEPAEGKHKGAADDDDDELDGVGGDVDVGGLDVEAVRGGAAEDHGGGDLGDESGGGNQEHGQAFDVRGGLEAANSLEGDVADHGPKGQAVDQGGEDLGAI